MGPVESFIQNHVHQRSQEEYQQIFDQIKEEDYRKLKPVYLKLIENLGVLGAELEEVFAETLELFKNKEFVELFKNEGLEPESLMEEKAAFVGDLVKKVFQENSKKQLGGVETMGPLVYVTPVKDTTISPVERVLPKTMEDFVKDLEGKPLETYHSLVNQVYRFGEDFPFPPYQELITKIKSYVDRRNDTEPVVREFLKEINRELEEGTRFTTSTRLIHKFQQLFPNNSKGVDGLKDEIKEIYLDPIDPVQFREEDGVIVFRFGCDKDLGLMYFVNTRGVPVFPLGVGSDEDLNPTPYDQHDGYSRYSFWNHDEQHTDIILMQESKYRLLNFLDQMIKTRDVYKSMNNRVYSFKAYEALLEKINKSLSQTENNDLKRAQEALLFYLLHEDEGGAYPLDPDFINRHFIVFAETACLPQFSYLIQDPLKSCEQGEGLKAALLHAQEQLSYRLKKYAYPKEYQTSAVIDALGEARGLLFNLLNEARLSQIGHAPFLDNLSVGFETKEIERNLAQDDEIFFEGNRTSAIFEKKEGQIEIKSLMINEMNPKLEVDGEDKIMHAEIQLAALNLPKERYFRLFS
jgi:hypothetical protein